MPNSPLQIYRDQLFKDLSLYYPNYTLDNRSSPAVPLQHLRVICFFTKLKKQNSKLSSHIYVKSSDGIDHICKVKKVTVKNE